MTWLPTPYPLPLETFAYVGERRNEIFGAEVRDVDFANRNTKAPRFTCSLMPGRWDTAASR